MLGADIGIALLCAAAVVAVGGVIGRALGRRRQRHADEQLGRRNASEIMIEQSRMCINCWNLCDPKKGDVLDNDTWWCRKCYYKETGK